MRCWFVFCVGVVDVDGLPPKNYIYFWRGVDKKQTMDTLRHPRSVRNLKKISVVEISLRFFVGYFHKHLSRQKNTCVFIYKPPFTLQLHRFVSPPRKLSSIFPWKLRKSYFYLMVFLFPWWFSFWWGVFLVGGFFVVETAISRGMFLWKLAWIFRLLNRRLVGLLRRSWRSGIWRSTIRFCMCH